jgi:hypothetical protein
VVGDVDSNCCHNPVVLLFRCKDTNKLAKFQKTCLFFIHEKNQGLLLSDEASPGCYEGIREPSPDY